MNKEFFQKNYRFGIDWLNGVLPLDDVKEFIDVLSSFSSKLRFERWHLASTGRYNYSTRLMLDNKASFQIMFNSFYPECFGSDAFYLTHDSDSSNNPYIFISISGDGLRYLQSIGGEVTALNKLLTYLYANGFKASRLDVYCDILDKNNKIVPLLKKSFDNFLHPVVDKPTITTNAHRERKNIQIRYSHDDNGKRFYNIDFCTHGSASGMFRCYNKLVEIKDGRLEGFSSDILSSYGVSDYWYRLEYELHKDTAALCFNLALQEAAQEGFLAFNEIFVSSAKRLFTPVTFDFTAERNLYRLPACDIWTSFLEMISTKCYILAMSGVPFVPSDRKRMRKNLDRISSYFYALLLEFNYWSPQKQKEFLSDARTRFENNKKYNLLRDEFSQSYRGYVTDIKIA